MGLLDDLFNPSTYNQGGLLSRLQPMLGQFPQVAGFDNPVSVGGYQMPRVGNPDQFQPQQAMTPPNAEPTQGQLQAAQQAPMLPAQQPRFLQENAGGLGAGLRGFANNLHTGPLGALIGGIGNAFGAQDQSQQDARALFNAYKAAGLDAPKAMLAVMNPKLAENMLGLAGTDDIKEYQFAKREDPNLTFEKFMARKKSVSGEYGLQAIWGVGKDGKPALVQLGKSGEAIQSKLPEGFQPAKDPIKVDAGTHWVILDPQSRQAIATVPKDLQGKEAAEERGKQQGQAQAALPGALTDAEATKTKIDELLKNEGLDSIVGPLDQYRPTWTLGKQGNDALARYNQLKGTAFLQAYGLLRGGGAITDIEGKKAESAMARLDRAQNEDDFRQALKDFRDAIDQGVSKLKQRAGGANSTPAAPQRIRINADGTVAQ